MVNGARVVGPAIAGALVAAIGEGWCFLLNGLSYIAVIAGLLMMDVPKRQRPAVKRSAWRDTIEGFYFVACTAPVRALLMLLGVISFAGMPYSVLMPVFAQSILHGGARGLGLLMGASGLGALAGALSLVRRSDVRGLGRWVATAAASFGVALICFSLSRTFWLSAALLIPVGASMMVEMASSNTLIQAMVPDALRGRVMAVYSMMFMGMAPFGALFAGWVAERVGAPATVAIGGMVCVVAATVFSLRLPALRGEARELIVAQEMAGGDPATEITGPGASAQTRA
jgi:MFS family permease